MPNSPYISVRSTFSTSTPLPEEVLSSRKGYPGTTPGMIMRYSIANGVSHEVRVGPSAYDDVEGLDLDNWDIDPLATYESPRDAANSVQRSFYAPIPNSLPKADPTVASVLEPSANPPANPPSNPPANPPATD